MLRNRERSLLNYSKSNSIILAYILRLPIIEFSIEDVRKIKKIEERKD